MLLENAPLSTTNPRWQDPSKHDRDSLALTYRSAQPFTGQLVSCLCLSSPRPDKPRSQIPRTKNFPNSKRNAHPYLTFSNTTQAPLHPRMALLRDESQRAARRLVFHITSINSTVSRVALPSLSRSRIRDIPSAHLPPSWHPACAMPCHAMTCRVRFGLLAECNRISLSSAD